MPDNAVYCKNQVIFLAAAGRTDKIYLGLYRLLFLIFGPLGMEIITDPPSDPGKLQAFSPRPFSMPW